MTVLTIAAQNIAAKSKAWQRQTFDSRLPAIRLGVLAYKPAIFLVQESGNAPYLRKLDAALKPAGLVRAPGGGRWRHIYYDPKRVRRIASGLIALNASHTKHAAWARFANKTTGELIFVTSVHLTAGGEDKAAARYREAEQLLRKTRAHTYGAPEVHGGDFNSFKLVGRVVFQPRYYRDALLVADAPSPRRTANTFNGRTTVKPDKRTQRYNSDHLDHFYVSRDLARRVTYWSQLPSVRPSDHNLIVCRIAI